MSTKRRTILALGGAAATGLAWLVLAAPGSHQEDTAAMASEMSVDNGFVVLPTVAPSMKAPLTPLPAVTPSAAATSAPPAPVGNVQPIMDPYAG